MVDVEFVVRTGQECEPVGTLGFAAPEAVPSDTDHSPSVPTQAMDWFSLGVTMFYALTGLEPNWVSGKLGQGWTRDELERLMSNISLQHPILAEFMPMIIGLTDREPSNRWSLMRAAEELESLSEQSSSRPPAPEGNDRGVGRTWAPDSLDRLIDARIADLVDGMTPSDSNLWKPTAQWFHQHDACSAWSGAAGGLAALTRAAAVSDNDELLHAVAVAAEWLGERLFTVPRILPGLCYGRGGTAWALYDAARLLDSDRLAGRALQLAKMLPTDGPCADITHGLSGAGLAHVHLWQATRDDELLDRCYTLAEAVLSAAHRDGQDWLWPTGADMDSALAGTSVYGYGHGVAGVGAFLLAASQVAAEDRRSPADSGRADRYLQAAIGAGETLARAARTQSDLISWPSAAEKGKSGGHGMWCAGPAGIGAFLIRLWAATGNQRFADLAEQCAAAAVTGIWQSNVGSCCGLAGIGNFLLDMENSVGEPKYRSWAEDVAAVIDVRYAFEDSGRRSAVAIGPEYAYGHAGVADFLVRLRHGGTAPWMPGIPGGITERR